MVIHVYVLLSFNRSFIRVLFLQGLSRVEAGLVAEGGNTDETLKLCVCVQLCVRVCILPVIFQARASSS